MMLRSRIANRIARAFSLVVPVALLMLVLDSAALSQRIVNIAPGFGTINTAIRGDTLSSGARVDTNTVYRLQRGGLYILNGTMEHNYPVHIEAASGTGAKPKIIQAVQSGGGAPSEAWSPRARLTMKNIYISAQDELGGNHERILRLRENNIRIVIDSCHLDLASQAGFRCDGVNVKIYFTNSIISNIGTGASPDNGRGVDDRGVDIDTLVLENSTFYNLTSRVIRDGGGFIKYCRVNHCTMFNIGQYGITIGPSYHAIFTNNVMANGGYYGNWPAVSRELLEIAPGPAPGTSTFLVQNNNFYLDSLVIKAYPDSAKPLPLYDSTTQAIIQNGGWAATVYQEMITFQNAPDAPVAVVQDFYTNGTVAPNPDLDTTGGPFNFKYANTLLAFARGNDGKPLGDLNWHNIPLTSVEAQGEGTPASFVLAQNYPNPFNPATQIQFGVARAGQVQLTVYDLLGKEVRTLVNEVLAPGTYTARFDGAGLASGAYFYVMSSQGVRLTRSMLLMK